MSKALIVLHGPFSCNSGIQVFHLAQGLSRAGWEVSVAAPSATADVRDVGEPEFECLTYADAPAFAERAGTQSDLLVHAWTPREGVRRVVESVVAATGAPYLVHLEDNEEHLASLSAPLEFLRRHRRVHPMRYTRFVADAAALTMVTESLEDFNFGSRPHLVIPPVVDAKAFAPGRDGAARRQELGIAPDEFVVVYHGNLHAANRGDLRSLYVAIGLLRARGRAVRLVRLGQDDRLAGRALRSLRGDVIELGVRPRAEVADWLAMADAFVQPGSSDAFNLYRFPSKVPEFLAMGRPVVLPDCNVGAALTDGGEALLLRTGSAEEIAGHLERLLDDPALAARLGQAGRAYARHHLTPATVVPEVDSFLRSVLHGPAIAPARTVVAAR